MTKLILIGWFFAYWSTMYAATMGMLFLAMFMINKMEKTSLQIPETPKKLTTQNEKSDNEIPAEVHLAIWPLVITLVISMWMTF